MEVIAHERARGLSIFGLFLVLLGAVLLLHRFHILHYGWTTLLWGCFGVVGAVMVIQAFAVRKRGMVFWGSMLFFTGIAVLIRRVGFLEVDPWDFPAVLSLVLGLSFLMMFIYDPRRVSTLIPVLFFGGYGVLYYLWWWDVVDWFDVRHYFRIYWPVIIILWGIAMIVQRKRPST